MLLISERGGLLYNWNYCFINVGGDYGSDFVFNKERFAMVLVSKVVDGYDSYFL